MDQITEKDILDELVKDFKDRTIIIITHRIQTLSAFQNIYHVDEGEIIAHGSYQELYKKEKFKKLITTEENDHGNDDINPQ